MSKCMITILRLAITFFFPVAVRSFHTDDIVSLIHPSFQFKLLANNNHDDIPHTLTKNKRNNFISHPNDRRAFLKTSTGLIGLNSFRSPALSVEENVSLVSLLNELKTAKTQLDPIPDLIKDEKWDSIRTILATPPLSSCWTKTGQSKPLLMKYADAIGNELPDGDELAALEGKEDAISHLRYLDMAVYNNVFNPIKTEGTAGATKELVRSYYEDPKMEYDASMKALNTLIQLGQ